jgi:hypothetical protein
MKRIKMITRITQLPLLRMVSIITDTVNGSNNDIKELK